MTDFIDDLVGAPNSRPTVTAYFRHGEVVLRIWAVSTVDGFRVDADIAEHFDAGLAPAELGARAHAALRRSSGLVVTTTFDHAARRHPTYLSRLVGLGDDTVTFAADTRMVSIAWNDRARCLFVTGSINQHSADLSFDYLSGIALMNPTSLELGLAILDQLDASS